VSGTFRGTSLLVPLVISGLGVMTVASAQTASSPFAKKTKKQAWETEDVAPSVPPAPTIPSAPAAPMSAPVSSPYMGANDVGTYAPPPVNSLQESAKQQIQSSAYDYSPNTISGTSRYSGDSLAGGAPQPSAAPNAYYPGRERGGQYQYQAPAQTYPAAPPQARPSNTGPFSAPRQAAPRNKWLNKFGLGGIKLAAQGFLKIGGALVDRSDSEDAFEDFDFVAHGRLEVEASAVTNGGMEYGVNLELREDYDRFRRGFGGRVGDCPPDVAGCSSALVGTTPTGLRGHTSQFYSTGPSNATETQIALESAHIFLRTAYGDITAGRDDGAAYLFSLGAPTLMMINASNSPVDYTGLDSVKTVNDASGFAEKITYTSPRLLGDNIGFGVQLGASYAPDARACGVDYCVRKNSDDPSGTLAPDLKDVMEVGLAIDRRFDNGLNVEATVNYATASNEIELAGFDDLQAWNTGLEVTLGDWTAGGSYLQSNNALADGDYTAWDAGITWKPSAYGFTASYGHAEDKNVDLTSDQFVFGVIREFDKFTLGTGVQYIERTTPLAAGNIISSQKEKATALFIEGGFKF
jgi:predicted porin